jgi:hypothetical protein
MTNRSQRSSRKNSQSDSQCRKETFLAGIIAAEFVDHVPLTDRRFTAFLLLEFASGLGEYFER